MTPRQTLFQGFLAGLLMIPLAACAPQNSTVSTQAGQASPEAATARTFAPRPFAPAMRHMVVAAHPEAVKAGFDILEAGGSALDAAIATQLVLGLVEPQSSGIGGGGFLLYYDGPNETLETWDGRETAPASVTPDLFLKPDGAPMGFFEAAVGGRAVGVPGLVKMLEDAHRVHGRMPWPFLFEPAIRLAQRGFAITPRLHGLLRRDKYLATQPAARSYFYQSDGSPLAVGTILQNPAYAQTLERIAKEGSSAFYTGRIAADIVAAVQSHDVNPGNLQVQDMAGYRAVRRDAVCAPFMDWRVCGMGPPSSGGTTVLQMLGLLERSPLQETGPNDALRAHLIAEAGRLAFADRNAYVADPDFASVPTMGLLEPAYLDSRSRLISPTRFGGTAQPGTPPGHQTSEQGLDGVEKGLSTTHLSIVDGEGNIVSMTTSIENAFGSRQMVRGFLLNNQLTDFSFRPMDQAGRPIANNVAPGKRPRSSMAPTIVFEEDSGQPVLVTGSPGGSRIIGYVAGSILSNLMDGTPIAEAVAAPHSGNRNGRTDLEKDRGLEGLARDLGAMGHTVRLANMTSGLHAIRLYPDQLEGGADPRREGSVMGR